MKIEREEMQRRHRAFAVAWATPGTETYRNGPAAYRAALGEDEPLTADACRQGAKRYLADPEVQAEIERVRNASGIKAGMTIETFILECLENEELMLESGAKGAAAAAVRYRELVGQALGYLGGGGRRTADTPEEPPHQAVIPRTREELLQIKQAVDTMLEISEPMPLPGEVTLEAEVTDAPDES